MHATCDMHQRIVHRIYVDDYIYVKYKKIKIELNSILWFRDIADLLSASCCLWSAPFKGLNCQSAHNARCI